MDAIVSKVGFHCVGPNRRGYLECLQSVAAAGRQVSLIKCRDNFGAIDEPLDLWPDVVTIGAMTDWDDANYDVEKGLRSITEAARKNPRIKFWEFYNERNGDYAQQADFYIALMPRLHDAGIGLCLFNSGKGTPQLPERDPSPYHEVARACAYALDNHYRVILGLHEYEGEGEYTIGRYQRLAAYLQDHGALIPIAITEWGWETHKNSHQYLEWVKANDRKYIGDERLIGLALWTLGGGGWGGSNYQEILPELGEYIAKVEPESIEPYIPPVEPPLVVEVRLDLLEARVTALEASMPELIRRGLV